MKQTQKERVRDALLKEGTIPAWRFIDEHPRILRIASRVDDLKNEGWDIKGFWKDDKYYYQLISYPEGQQYVLA